MLTVKDPYTGELIQELRFASPSELNQALQNSVAAQKKWRDSAAWERAQLLNDVRAELEKTRNEFADLMVREAGKPVTLANAEIDRALGVLNWAAAETQRFAGELLRLDAARGGRRGFGIHTRFPVGVILGITPFNFPLNLVLHKIAPAVAAGNGIVIKPSPSTPLTALKLIALFEKHVPGLVQCVLADDAATEALTRAPEVALVSFTGSARVGKLIQKQAYDKPVVLELGGNAWVVVLEDVPTSAFSAISKRINGAAYGYAGQSCISVQNVAIADSLWKNFGENLREGTREFIFGETRSPDVLCGPVINEAAAKRIRGELAKVGKAEVVQSGSIRGSLREGNLIAPSLVLSRNSITEIEPDLSSLRQQEIFAPVMLAGKFGELDRLIATINSSPYGLQAGVFTQNFAAIEKLYRELEVGGVVINDVPTTRYDHQPYGGIKDSGHGREGLRYAMEEMTYSKFLALSSQI